MMMTSEVPTAMRIEKASATARVGMMTARAAISARPLTACPSAVPTITPGRAAAINPAA